MSQSDHNPYHMVTHRGHVCSWSVSNRHLGFNDVLVGNNFVDSHTGASNPFQLICGIESLAVRPPKESISAFYSLNMIRGFIGNDEIDIREGINQFVGVVSTHVVGSDYNF